MAGYTIMRVHGLPVMGKVVEDLHENDDTWLLIHRVPK